MKVISVSSLRDDQKAQKEVVSSLMTPSSRKRKFGEGVGEFAYRSNKKKKVPILGGGFVLQQTAKNEVR